jgi:hypothetical protein
VLTVIKKSAVILFFILLHGDWQLVLAQPADAVQGLEAKWRMQRGEIVTAAFDVTLYRVFDPKNDSLTAEDVSTLLTDEKKLPANRLLDFKKKCESVGHFVIGPWEIPTKVFIEGQQIRNDTPQGTFSFDGLSTTHYDVTNKQVDLTDGRAPFRQIGLNDIRYVPDLSKLGWPKQGRVTPNPSGHLVAEVDNVGARVRVVVDPTVSLVREFRINGLDGMPLEAIWQVGTMDIDSFKIPTFTVHCVFAKGKLKLCSVHHITRGEINHELKATTFQVSIPTDVQIVDRRGDRTKPAILITEKPITNVVAVANNPASFASTEGSIPSSGGGTYRIVLMVAGILLAASAGILLYSRRLRSVKEKKTA